MTEDQQRELLRSIDSRLQALEETAEARREVETELLQMYQSVKGFMTILGWFERASIWLAKMSVAGGLLWFLFKESVSRALKSDQGG